jgi:energy-coupling factor transport system permease protein
VNTSTATPSPSRRRPWRVVDIVVASVLGAAAGVVFWAWNFAYGGLEGVLSLTPGLSGITAGGWLFAGVLGGLVIRKPGAALYTELVAAVVEMLVGTQWGFSTFLWGALEGLGAEIGFAVLLYTQWRVTAALLAGALTGLTAGLLDTTFYYGANDATFKAVYIVSAVVSGVVLAGIGSWAIMRGLAGAGALDRFAAGREARADRAAGDPAARA